MDEEALRRKEEPQKLVRVEGTDDLHVFLSQPLPQKNVAQNVAYLFPIFANPCVNIPLLIDNPQPKMSERLRRLESLKPSSELRCSQKSASSLSRVRFLVWHAGVDDARGDAG